MARLPDEAATKSLLSGNGGYDADRKPLLFENGPLLDMKLDITQQAFAIEFRGEDLIRISPKAADGIGHGDSLGISTSQIFAVESSSERSAAEISALVANAFLIGEADHLNCKWQRDVIMKTLDTGNRREDPERAVKLACIADGIQMRTKQQRFGLWTLDFGLWTLIPANKITYGILADVHARFTHPGCDEVVYAAHGRGAESARESSFFVTELAERIHALHNSFGEVFHTLFVALILPTSAATMHQLPR